MTTHEAKKIAREFNDNTRNPSKEDLFMFTEAMDILINKDHNPRDMLRLGGVYYEMRQFDLALKYHEMAY